MTASRSSRSRTLAPLACVLVALAGTALSGCDERPHRTPEPAVSPPPTESATPNPPPTTLDLTPPGASTQPTVRAPITPGSAH